MKDCIERARNTPSNLVDCADSHHCFLWDLAVCKLAMFPHGTMIVALHYNSPDVPQWWDVFLYKPSPLAGQQKNDKDLQEYRKTFYVKAATASCISRTQSD